MKRLGQTPRGLTLFLLYGQYLSCEEAGSSRGAPMRGIGIEASRPTEPRRGEGHPAPATRMKWAGLRQGSAFSLNVRLRATGRTTSSDIRSGDIRYGVIRQGQGLAVWQRRIGTCGCEGVGLRVPLVEMSTNFRQGHVDAVAQIELSYLSANLSGIAFYDSIVVFDKRKHFLPKNELR